MILLSTSVPLGLVVLVGVPLLVCWCWRRCCARCTGASSAQRELIGELTDRANDIVAGLRVLRGIGGEQVFAARYRARVAGRCAQAGVRVARIAVAARRRSRCCCPACSSRW